MRHVALTTRSLVASAAVLVATTAIGAAAAAAATFSTPQAATQTVIAPALVEVPECWGSTSPTDTLPTFDGAMVQTITVTVEPTSLLRIDQDGRVSAAATNTGCAPRATDHLFVVQADGSLRPAEGIDVDAIAWTGDFTRYGFVPQG